MSMPIGAYICALQPSEGLAAENAKNQSSTAATKEREIV